MHTYSIMPLNTTYVEEICQDIVRQKREGIAEVALFKMTLVPEGNPVINKAEIFCEKYDVFRDRLKELGVECGILVQATIGHGYKLNQSSPFQKYVNLTDGQEKEVCCPYDEDFREHFKGVMETLSRHRPKVIMVDDDFRLIGRQGKGCACPLHMKEFWRRSGTSITRAELYEHIQKYPEDDRLTDIFIETQKDALLGAIRAMREGIDSVDPGIQGVFCCCGNSTEFAADIAHSIAGKDNPSIVRLHNGNYCVSDSRKFSTGMYRAALQSAVIKDRVDYILAETDTCPQNRYSTSARYLHAHFTGSILEGLVGAKHWITRLIDYEPASGEAYRKILAKNRGFYQELMELVRQMKPFGCCIPFSKVPSYPYRGAHMPNIGWTCCVLDRLGLPLYFSTEYDGAIFLENDSDGDFNDNQIMEMFGKTLVLSGEAARRLNERGFDAYTGVKVREWKGRNISGERLCVNGKVCKAQIGALELIPIDCNVVIDSEMYHVPDGQTKEVLFPGTTVYKNPCGGTTIVFSGTPLTKFNILEAFAFLNESRKLQLIRLLKETGNLPVYCPGDDEIFLRAGEMNNGDMFAAVVNVGLDTVEELQFVTKKAFSQVEMLHTDGAFRDCEFGRVGDLVTVKVSATVLEPVVLIFRI